VIQLVIRFFSLIDRLVCIDLSVRSLRVRIFIAARYVNIHIASPAFHVIKHVRKEHDIITSNYTCCCFQRRNLMSVRRVSTSTCSPFWLFTASLILFFTMRHNLDMVVMSTKKNWRRCAMHHEAASRLPPCSKRMRKQLCQLLSDSSSFFFLLTMIN
jgi:hypothetical protein